MQNPYQIDFQQKTPTTSITPNKRNRLKISESNNSDTSNTSNTKNTNKKQKEFNINHFHYVEKFDIQL